MKVVIDLIAGETQLVAEFGKWLWGSEWQPWMTLPVGEWWHWEKDSAAAREKRMYNRNSTKTPCVCVCGKRTQHLQSSVKREWVRMPAARKVSGGGWRKWDGEGEKEGVGIMETVTEGAWKWEGKYIWPKFPSTPQVLPHTTETRSQAASRRRR